MTFQYITVFFLSVILDISRRLNSEKFCAGWATIFQVIKMGSPLFSVATLKKHPAVSQSLFSQMISHSFVGSVSIVIVRKMRVFIDSLYFLLRTYITNVLLGWQLYGKMYHSICGGFNKISHFFEFLHHFGLKLMDWYFSERN